MVQSEWKTFKGELGLADDDEAVFGSTCSIKAKPAFAQVFFTPSIFAWNQSKPF